MLQSGRPNLLTFFHSKVKRTSPTRKDQMPEEVAVAAEAAVVAAEAESAVVTTTLAEVAESRNSDLTSSLPSNEHLNK
jgi:hypothetical protein